MLSRPRKRTLLERLPVAGGLLFGSLFIATLPLTLPVALLQHHRVLWRMRKVARQFACMQCGTILGEQGLQLGEMRWAEFMRQRDAPVFYRRVVRDLHALCAGCGAEYGYDEKRAQFVLRASGRLPTA